MAPSHDMDERKSSGSSHFDRRTEQAIVALKKGAHLLKYGRRGKPKFCPFRLSPDEQTLIWYSGKEEKHLRLSAVTKIVPGQRTLNFQRQPQPEKECQSFSLLYGNGEMTLDLICKDKDQAECWFVGLTALVSKSHQSRHLAKVRNGRGAHSCINSPAGHARRKQNFGLLEDPTRFSQVRSLCGSPPRSLADRSFSDAPAHTSGTFSSLDSKTLSKSHTAMDAMLSRFSYLEAESMNDKMSEMHLSHVNKPSLAGTVSSYDSGCPLSEKDESLRDVLMWGEGIEAGIFGGGVDKPPTSFDQRFDALLPKLLQSTSMLDVTSLSCGGKHTALITKQGEVFCWGEEKGGRLGHKIKMDAPHPKVVESLVGIHVDIVACGEYQTCAITESGELYTWGESIHNINPLDKETIKSRWLPRMITGPLEGLQISNVACGEWHTVVVTSNGKLFTYGDGTFGVLGHGDLCSYSQPKEVEALRGLRVKSVACGPWHTAAIVEIRSDQFHSNGRSGKLFTWGDGDKGRLGHNDRERKLLPTRVAQLVDHDFIQVSCGRMLTVALDVIGRVYTMGSVTHGQLGGSQCESKTYVVVEGNLRGETVKDVSTGSYHVAVLTSTGSVYTWGMGANGRLGLGDIEDRNSPCLVEALKDRQVQNVACGSSFTAAICLHRTISSSDQSFCSGCRMIFGFTRKKHNCYNCGSVFCHSCSSKKSLNAALAPNKSKQYRVCEPCFCHLKKPVDSNVRQEMQSPRPPLSMRRPISDLRVNQEETVFTPSQLLSPKIYMHDEVGVNEGQKSDDALASANITVRWGQVSCPALFDSKNGGSSMMFVLPPKLDLCITSCTTRSDRSFGGTGNSPTEVQRLRAEAKRLEKQCEIRSEKLQEYKEQIEETWLFAREEAARCKAAKEVIKVLSTRLNALADKFSVSREERNLNNVLLDKDDIRQPQITTASKESLELDDVKSFLASSLQNPSSDVKFNKEKLRNLMQSPSHTTADGRLKGAHVRHQSQGQETPVDELQMTRFNDKQNGTNGLKTEWVEQDEPGVYITFTILPCGLKGLKRVRFSRKRFSEKEAEKWWEENQLRVYKKYEIEGIISSGAEKMSGY